MGKNKGLCKMVLGAALGVGAGVLFAPRSGRETRAILKCKMEECMDEVCDMDLEDMKKEFDKKIKEIEKDIKDLDKEKVLDEAKEKAIVLKEKVDDLLDVAMQKGSFEIQKAADKVREKALDVIKNVLVNLEEEK